MNNTTLFNFKGNNVRVVTVSGEPWLMAADVCRSLGLTNVSMAVQPLSSDEKALRNVEGVRSGRANFISEPGLYKLVQSSRKPEAREFDRWVRHIVLPAIRKDGGYIHGEEHVVSGAMTEDELVFKAMEVMKRKVDRLSAENAKQEAIINEHLKFMTVGEYREHHHRYWEQSTTTKMSVAAKRFCEANGLGWTKQPRLLPKNGKMLQTEVNVYPVEALDAAAAQLGVFEDA